MSIFYKVNAWFRFRRIASLIRELGGSGKALDVGCALGHSVSRLSQVGLDSVGCDISAWATKKAKELHPGIEIFRADAYSLPFKSSTFNVTTTFETLEHCDDLNAVLSEIKRVTKPGGLVMFSIPTTDLNDTYADKTHLWHKSLRDWLRLFEDDFQLLKVEYFMKVMKYVDGKTCTTFIVLRNRVTH